MAITLKEIIAHVESLGFKHMPGLRENSEIGLRFATESYVNTDGDHSLLIVCAISDEGRYLEVFAPAAYTTANCKYKAAMFACMLKAAFMTKHLQLEHDPDDGEVRLAVDMPVLDGTVTADQLCALIFAITLSLESFHPVFAHAMSTGKVEAPAPAAPTLSPELQELISKVGGLDNLEALVATERSKGRA
jgi:hypothetical protein